MPFPTRGERPSTSAARTRMQPDDAAARSRRTRAPDLAGGPLMDRRNAFEFCCQHLTGLYAPGAGSSWRPHSGSLVNRRALTASDIDSRDFPNARNLARTQVVLPPLPASLSRGGVDCDDHTRIWATRDRARDKHPNMVLLHGAGLKRAERVGACQAENRKVGQIAFKPDCPWHKNAASSCAATSRLSPCGFEASDSPARALSRTA
jgi:hypothetical protein